MKVVITGGELFNKGAQSMTFTVVNEVRKRFPDAQIALLSTTDFVRSETEKASYKFDILPWDLRFKLRRYFIFKPFIKAKYYTPKQEKLAWQRFCEADLHLDISGFGLASVFSKQRVANYLLDMALARRQKIPLILMPQSFGPFKFKGLFGTFFNMMAPSLIKYPKKIYAREMDGIEHLKQLNKLDTVKKSVDLVLQSSEVSADRIFNCAPELSFSAPDNAVAVVPNQKVKVHGSGNSVEQTFSDLVQSLLDKGKTVYLLRHSFEDKSFIDVIKSRFPDEDRVVAITDDLNALQLENIISKMQYIIASRYHGVVHAYRQNVPCLVLGWAVKYQELTGLLKQQNYCFDLTKSVSSDALLDKLQLLDSQCEQEKATITQKMQEVRGEFNVFAEVFDKS